MDWDTQNSMAEDQIAVDPTTHLDNLRRTLESAQGEIGAIEARLYALRSIERSCEAALKILKEQHEVRQSAKMPADPGWDR